MFLFLLVRVPWFYYLVRSRISRTCLSVVNLTSPRRHNLGTGLKPESRAGSLLASANFTDFVTVDDGASAHDAHLDAALADYDDEFTSLQLQTGQLDPVSSGAAAAAAAAAAGGGGAAAAAPAPMGHF